MEIIYEHLESVHHILQNWRIVTPELENCHSCFKYLIDVDPLADEENTQPSGPLCLLQCLSSSRDMDYIVNTGDQQSPVLISTAQHDLIFADHLVRGEGGGKPKILLPSTLFAK